MDEQFLRMLGIIFVITVLIEVCMWVYGKILERKRDEQIAKINAYFDNVLEDLRKGGG